MDFFSCTSACRPCDLATDTVKFDAAAIGSAAAASPALERSQEEHQYPSKTSRERKCELRRPGVVARGSAAVFMDQEHEEQCRPKEQEEERARQKREAQLRREREEEGEEAEDPHRQKEQRECEERLRLEEQVRAAEEVAEEAAQGAFAEKAARRAGQDRKRKAAVAAFLKMHGFTGGVSGAKRNLMNSTYPLHRAAKTADAQMVEYLLMEGADPTQANSAGRNAAQVAQSHDSKCSHAVVLRILNSSNARRVGGA
eukprot:CAMPEP_0203844550 /NCGR_PEP_ID=MMETSP0359-20131031/3274_1 /ASSEMBLY_ACC=CAM_ASM_000338 /TAXON_ID=268821 /ORGANISM="Scrippsiella Hangoei, Strain SHTV-5" /LENGTH=255 /DNA_ID=CAMNT_0050759517 /DNA_START=90 /DNA_END=859 /DNA_ORIENTATION=+